MPNMQNMQNFGFGKKCPFWFWFQKICSWKKVSVSEKLVLEKVSVSEKMVSDKKSRIPKILYEKKISVSVPVKILVSSFSDSNETPFSCRKH